MDLQQSWDKALRNTEIIRSRLQDLMTFSDTHVPYILLSESTINLGDTIVRTGEVIVERPSLILPPHVPQFNGFEFDQDGVGADENSIVNFLIVRGIAMPSLKFNNKTNSLDLFEDKLHHAVKHYKNMLQYKEDVHTGLIVCPEDCWQFSVIIFICAQIIKNANTDIKRLLDEYRKKLKEDK